MKRSNAVPMWEPKRERLLGFGPFGGDFHGPAIKTLSIQFLRWNGWIGWIVRHQGIQCYINVKIWWAWRPRNQHILSETGWAWMEAVAWGTLSGAGSPGLGFISRVTLRIISAFSAASSAEGLQMKTRYKGPKNLKYSDNTCSDTSFDRFETNKLAADPGWINRMNSGAVMAVKEDERSSAQKNLLWKLEKRRH